MKNITSENRIGVIVGRFQEPELHPGHRYLIEQVLKRHDEVLIVLGVAYTSTSRNPLSYTMRKQMIESQFPKRNITFIPSESLPSSNAGRSGIIDERIRRAFPGRDAVIYGSRTSIIHTYCGSFARKQIRTVYNGSATEIRKRVHVVDSPDFRRGVTYEVNHRKPIAYPSIDVAVVDNYKVLLVYKKSEDGKMRFPGVFFDRKLDESYEAAAARCVRKEIPGIETGYRQIIGSCKIKDWRYYMTRDGVVTLLISMTYLKGRPSPGKGVDGATWVDMHELPSVLVEAHLPLGEMLKKSR